MVDFYQLCNGQVELHIDDCMQTLARLPRKRAQVCVTSPPYWRLRDEGISGQIGLEKTPQQYAQSIVKVLRETRRVLRDDGTVWLVLGDKYNGGGRLLGIPWRVAFALENDGWIIQQEIIWAKPNAMPESAKRRCSRSHETIFQLSQIEHPFYDGFAIRELLEYGNGYYGGDIDGLRGANKNTVWWIPVEPHHGRHDAVFPIELARRCIKAGSSGKGCCARCGAPWKPIMKKEPMHVPGWTINGREGPISHRKQSGKRSERSAMLPSRLVDWSPTCRCSSEIVPCTVLDPFAGSGTTGLAARAVKRRAVLIEINPGYTDEIIARVEEGVVLRPPRNYKELYGFPELIRR